MTRIKGIATAVLAIIAGSLAAVILYSSPNASKAFYKDAELRPISNSYIDNVKSESTHAPKYVAGFLPYWAVGNNAKIYPEYMDEIIYFGVTLNKDGSIRKNDDNGNPLSEWSNLNSQQFISYKEKSKETNTKMSVAIKNFNNEEIISIISNPSYKKNAISNIIELVNSYGFDGVNIDFEYFTSTEKNVMIEFNNFLTELSQSLRDEKTNIIISFDVNASVVYEDPAYDMVKIGEVVDHIIVMGYDYHTANSKNAGPVSPINAPKNSPSLTKTIQSLRGRTPMEKIILAIPFYGYEWQTINADHKSPTVEGTGAAATYKRVRELIQNKESVAIHYDDVSKSPWITYTQNGMTRQIYYEDEKSISEKVNFVLDENLNGIAIWALGFEGDYIEPWQVIKEQIR